MVSFKSFFYFILILFVLQYGSTFENPNPHVFDDMVFMNRNKLVQVKRSESLQIMIDRLREKRKDISLQMRRQLSDEEKEMPEEEVKSALEEEKASVEDNNVKEEAKHGMHLGKGFGHGKGMHHGKKAKFAGKLRSEEGLNHHHHHVYCIAF